MAWLIGHLSILLFGLAIGVMVGRVLMTLSRANELFYIEYRKPTLLVIRGVVPAALETEFKAVLRTQQRVTLRGVRESRRSRLIVTGTDDGQAQRLRNVFAMYPQKLERRARTNSRNLGQVLGIAWLAWALNDNAAR